MSKTNTNNTGTTAIVNVPVNAIIFNHYQVDGTINRETVEEIKSSLIQNKDNGSKGLLQITRGRMLADGTYEQAFGRHRLIAFQELAEQNDFWNEMPLLVSELNDLEMFELMGIENFQRRNISPLEEANIFNTYMTDFGKSSVEAGLKFGKSEEYVRQSVRYLNLPEAAQTMLEQGTLNKSGGRDLLVLEKIGGAALVADAIDLIIARPDENVSELVETVLRQSDDTNYLDKSADWFSANKNFPRKHLPALDSKTIGDVLEAAEGHAKENVGYLKDIVRLVSAGMEVTDEAFPQVTPESLERVRVLANPTPCEKCPLHAVLNGDHYCGLPLCMERKVTAWKAKVQEDKINEIGVPLYQKSDGPYVKLDRYESADKKLWAAKGADLRIIPSKYEYNNFPGLDYDTAAVLVGAAAEKRLKKIETAKKKDETESASRKNEAQIRDTKREFAFRFAWEVASRAFEGALDGVSSPKLLAIFANALIGDADFPEDVEEYTLVDEALKMKKASDQSKELRRIAMHGVIDGEVRPDIDAKKIISKMAKDYETTAQEWNYKLPSDFTKQAEKYQAELDAALKEIK